MAAAESKRRAADVAFDHTVEPALEPEAVAESIEARAAPVAEEAPLADVTAVSGEVFTDPVFDQTVEPALELGTLDGRRLRWAARHHRERAAPDGDPRPWPSASTS